MNPLFYVAIHTVGIYLFLVIALRTVGRRELEQLHVIDLIIIIIMGSAVETAMVAGNTTLMAGLVSAGTLLLLNRLLAVIFARSRRLRRLVLGQPIVLVSHGKFVHDHLSRMGLTEEDVVEAIHERGRASVEEVRYAVLEADGEINVVPYEKKSHRIDLMPSNSVPGDA